jgi:Uma2 family endonuclease
MAIQMQATIDDLYKIDGKAELVNGQLVLDSPTGGLPGYASVEILSSLRIYAKRTKSGHAIGDNIGFIVDLPNRQSFCPDAAFYTGTLTMKFLEGAPVFAIEVRSEHDYGLLMERKLAQKRTDYFAAGTQVVWDVDLQSNDVIRVYRATNPEQPTVYKRGEIAEAEPAVPHWTMPVDDLFPPAP